jgi:hypothetical protein
MMIIIAKIDNMNFSIFGDGMMEKKIQKLLRVLLGSSYSIRKVKEFLKNTIIAFLIEHFCNS